MSKIPSQHLAIRGPHEGGKESNNNMIMFLIYRPKLQSNKRRNHTKNENETIQKGKLLIRSPRLRIKENYPFSLIMFSL